MGNTAFDTPLFTSTFTVKAPLTYAGVTAVKLVLVLTTTLLAATPPTKTVVVGVKPVPVRLISVPPATLPKGGLTPLKVGACTVYVKPELKVALPMPLVTNTSFTKEPFTYAGIVRCKVVALSTTIPVAKTPPI